MPVPQKDHLLIRAARGEDVERSPIWAMRQAGRRDPEFRKVRADLGFFEFSETVDKAVAATLCPRRFGVDGIILFYDITTLPVAMGLQFELKPSLGPLPNRPIRTRADLDRLDVNPDPERFRHVIELLRTVKRELNGELPVLAFAGAPFTVATYCIGTGKHIDQTRRFSADHPTLWRALLDRISTATIGFLKTLIAEGAEFYQLFDSWAGELSPEEYDDFAQPYHSEIFAAATGVPRALYVKECPFFDRMTKSGADVISCGISHDLAELRLRYPGIVLQGNVNAEILRVGTPDMVAQAVRQCKAAGQGTKHIINLNHGVEKTTPVENFEAFIRAAKTGM